MRLPSSLICILLLAGLTGGCGDDSQDSAKRPMTLALDFQPNAAHAGIYAATERDLDRRHDLDLQVRAPSSSTDSLKLLAGGRADVAIVDIHDLGLARERGADVVGIGALVQRPLASIIAQPRVSRPRDLEDKRVGVTGLPSDEAVLRAAVEADGGDFSKVRRTTIGFSAVPSLAAGRVDAVVTFWNAEGVALDQQGVPTSEFRVDRYGAPRYPELVVATTSERIERDPALLRDLLATLADGTDAALGDRARTVTEITAASDSERTLVSAQLEAIAPALRPSIELRRETLEAWSRFDARFGIVEQPPNVADAFRFGLTPSRRR